MPVNNEYKRYFIILQEDEKGFELAAGKIPTGYVKIEIKNAKAKLTAFIQNVRINVGIEYRMLLVAPSHKAAVDLGKVIVDNTGRGEINTEFEPDNVLGSRLSLGDFLVAAVSSNNRLPLSGYTGREKSDWKGKYEIINARHDKQPIEQVMIPKAPIAPIKEMQPIMEIPKKEIQPIMEVPEQEMLPVVIPNIPVVEPKVEKNMTFELELNTEIIKNEPPQVVAPIIINVPEPVEQKPMPCAPKPCPPMPYMPMSCMQMHTMPCQKHDYYNTNMYRKLEKAIRKLRHYEPFHHKTLADAWFKVGDGMYLLNSIAIPFVGFMMPLSYPFLSENSYMMGAQDYMLGVSYEDEGRDDDERTIRYIYFGIPGQYSSGDAMYYGSKGYTHFMPHKERNYGYWIMVVDLKTGKIII